MKEKFFRKRKIKILNKRSKLMQKLNKKCLIDL